MTSPLIADYVKSDSRGQASALSIIGMFVGSAFSVVVLVGGTKNMDLDSAYTFAAVLLTAMSIPLFCLIREPEVKDRS